MPKFNETDALNDFRMSISRGDIVGVSPIVFEGLNIDIDSGSGEEDLWGEGGNLSYLTTGETLSFVSTDPQDNPSGTGIGSIFLLGTDDNHDRVAELVILNGTTPVITTNTFRRAFTAFAASAGSGLTNAGNIVGTATSAATVQLFMEAGTGTAMMGHQTIRNGKGAIIMQIELDAAKISGGGTPSVLFKVYARLPGSGQPWIVILRRRLDTSVQDQLIIPFPLSNQLIAGADIRATASSDTNNTEASVRITLLEYDT